MRSPTIALRKESYHCFHVVLTPRLQEDFLDGWTLAGVWAGIKIAWATKTLVQNLFDIPKECGESTFDCLFQVGNTLMSYFALGYQAYSNLPDMERDGVAVFAITNLSDGTYIGSHLPVSDDSAVTLRDLSITRPNLKTWAHVATRYTDDGMPLHSIYHRLVSDEDLGRPNDGTSHHLIVQTANLTAPWEKKTRLNARADSSNSHGVVGEYLWQNNDNSLWGDLHNACSGTLENQCDLGSSLANKFESEQSEVGCAVPGVAKGDGSYAGLDSGLFAYGWNDKAFDFQGRAGSWLDGCAPAPRRCSPK